jgi:methyl-accepting chemotaxis protein
MSRLKRKLLLYFILIAIVSTSVTAEIILELGSPVFKNEVKKNLHEELAQSLGKKRAAKLMKEEIDFDKVFSSIGTLQVRAILLLVIVSLSIGGAFFQYTKDIVSPMEGMVSATQKMADGDLSVSIPVVSQDEIGQVASLINDMSINLQEMILQVKQEVMRLKEKIALANDKIMTFSDESHIDEILKTKKMKVKDFKKFYELGGDLEKLMEEMVGDLSALQAFANMYKVFQLSSQMNQNDIDKHFNGS